MIRLALGLLQADEVQLPGGGTLRRSNGLLHFLPMALGAVNINGAGICREESVSICIVHLTWADVVPET